MQMILLSGVGGEQCLHIGQTRICTLVKQPFVILNLSDHCVL